MPFHHDNAPAHTSFIAIVKLYELPYEFSISTFGLVSLVFVFKVKQAPILKFSTNDIIGRFKNEKW